MEVHAHTNTALDPDPSTNSGHRGRKKWTHYFWEFLMLFLAVFCGFLAENQREHMIEHKREKQYMITMLEDLKNDTFLLNEAVRYWDTINYSIDSVADAIQLPLTRTDLPKAYRYLNKALDYYSFKYNDRTLAQLKNAGGFRLIRNKIVANKIIAYDQMNNDAIIIIKDQHNSFYETTVQLRNKIFVQEIINTIYNQYEKTPPPLSGNNWIDSMLKKNKNPFSEEIQTALLFEFKNAILAYRKDFTNMNFAFTYLREATSELIKLIRENYHLK